MTNEKQIIRGISDRIVEAQKPIRILDAIKWDDSVKQQFFKNKCEKLPEVDKEYYQRYPLSFDCDSKIEEFRLIQHDIKSKLGQFHGLGNIMSQQCEEYIHACTMLDLRGTKQFAEYASELYGSPDDVFYPGGPKLNELSELLGDILKQLKSQIQSELDVKKYSADEAVKRLHKKLADYFKDDALVKVMVDDNIVADAAAGADIIKLNSGVKFSERDIRYLEVHEGWTHVGTTINGSLQPYCTFLSKGSPSSAVTQEGLAVITEIFTFSSYPQRTLKIVNRLTAMSMANQGANFIDVFKFFKEQGLDEADSYNYAVRIFRGSVPDGKPFTKDLSYTKGFLLIYNYIRLAAQAGVLNNVPLLFIGKTLLKDLAILAEYLQSGIIIAPKYLPPQFSDLAALSAWMSFSLFLNKLDINKLAETYRDILR